MSTPPPCPFPIDPGPSYEPKQVDMCMQIKLFQPTEPAVNHTQQNKPTIAVMSYFRKVPRSPSLFWFCIQRVQLSESLRLVRGTGPDPGHSGLGPVCWPVKCSEMLQAGDPTLLSCSCRCRLPTATCETSGSILCSGR